MVSIMVKRSLPFAIVARLQGCFFIPNFGGNSLRNVKVTWKTPYTIFSISCFAFYMFLEFLFAKQFSHVVANISDTLSRSLLLVVFGVCVVKVLVNLSVMLTKSKKLLAFYRKSEAFETSTGFSLHTHSLRHSSAHRWNAVRACGVYMALALCFTNVERFILVDMAQSVPTEWSVLMKIFGVSLGFGFIFYESLSYFFLRSCIQVLGEYIQVQVELFQKDVQCSNVHLQPQFSSQVQAVRLHMSKIKELKELLNDIWAEALIVTCANAIILDCVVLDAVFHDGIRKELWLAAFYSLYAPLCIVDLAFTGQGLINEARKLQGVILMVPAFGAPESYLQQLRYLHESVDPDGMCLGGGGFFLLKRSLLLSMTGSIIIFGVILVQTSNTVTLKINAG
ncbi:hypothetical protein IscW_ISCW014323 [Ixodes scapularis]|uniref:Uncharacterized protein n=1 Tax=Ixodes scapularis TaxID=6945 RepID=B7QHC2_IXOSC|nr:hypothetical protein IscW_ISCW014323 [Ixodes scapularis]|eukprot:XP_002414579.1 hypothetical protein IscW_ISCW014323 [Ixodes scapularis]